MIKELDSTYNGVLKPVQTPLDVSCITWNLFASLPPQPSLRQLLIKVVEEDDHPDALMIGTQECERTLGASLFCQNKQQWEAMLGEILDGMGYVCVASQVMRGLHSIVFVLKHRASYVQVYSKQKLRAGTCNIMGNKGAISIHLSIGAHSIQFINCHLAPHQTQSDKRNATIHRILTQMVKSQSSTSVFFLGDFNYRIQMTKKHYQSIIENKQNTNLTMKYTSMLADQQLRNQQQLKKTFLPYYSQGQISFPPTYKINPNSQHYNNERIPGWTDRIFHRISQFVERKKYKCEYNIMGSDHRPVYASYEIKENATSEANFIQVYGTRTCSLI